MFELDPSDVALLLDLGLAAFLAVFFAVGRPRTWHRDRLGWVIFGYALALVALLFLIVYGIVFGQRVIEPIRLGVGAALGVAIVFKIWAVYRERREGRVDGSRPAERKTIMSEAKFDAVKSATEIWYKSQRVLRTLVAVVIPSFLGFALLLPQLIQALGLPVDNELRLWLVGVAAAVSAVAAAITRIMAIPTVNAWLVKIGLGSVPQSAIATQTAPHGVPVVVVQEDPKASGRS